MTISEFEIKLNQWGHEEVPFLFLVDFELENLQAWKINEVPEDILFSLDSFSGDISPTDYPKKISLTKYPISFSEYNAGFEFVKERIGLGDSYLTNLTIKTKIDIDSSLEELFLRSKAKYKFCWKNKFLVFSPETFIQIKQNKIYSFPMKGTIDASFSNAEQLLLSDPKELSE